MKRARQIVSMAMACLMVMLLAACAGGNSASTPDASESSVSQSAPASSEAAETQSGGTDVLRLAGGSDWGGPNPFRHTTRGPGTTKMEHVFDSLLEAGENGWVPWLAESYDVSDDGLVYTFVLHSGATWHDGEPVTAEDVGFTIDYYRENTNIGGQLGVGENFLVDSYEISGENTIVITTTKALSTNLSKLGKFPVIPKHIWESVEDPITYDSDNMYIGCGMYKFVSYDAATGTYEFEAYENYYGHTAGAQHIQYVPVSDTMLAFDNGEIVLCDVPADLFEQYTAMDGIAYLPKNDEMGYMWLFNADAVPAFADLEVRKALYQALDREAMVDAVFRGMGHVASAGWIPQIGRASCRERV